MENNLVAKKLNGEDVLFLEGGTTYLPTIYIKKNQHWGKWMAFEAQHHEVITNRTFNSEEDCVNFVNTYDKQTTSTLDDLYDNIVDNNLREFAKTIDFSNPIQITAVIPESRLERQIQKQTDYIQQKYEYGREDIELIVAFFEAHISLYSNRTNNADERYFYICIADDVSVYKSWKTVSVAKALFNTVNSYHQKYFNAELETKERVEANFELIDDNELKFHTENPHSNGEICHVQNGTKYLPSIYMQHNTHWDKWMIFEEKTKQLITNRTFVNRQDCIDFINSYDEQSDRTLARICSEIKEHEIRDVLKEIDFSYPQPVQGSTPKTEELAQIVHSQKDVIANSYQVDKDSIELICQFFNGTISLYANKTSNKTERTFYSFNHGNTKVYTSWKTVALAVAFFNNVLEYEKEKHKHKHFRSLIGKSLIDIKGNGFYFVDNIADTSFMYVQKVQVKVHDGVKKIISDLPLTPPFLVDVNIQRGLITLKTENRYLNRTNNNEVYSFKIVS